MCEMHATIASSYLSCPTLQENNVFYALEIP